MDNNYKHRLVKDMYFFRVANRYPFNVGPGHTDALVDPSHTDVDPGHADVDPGDTDVDLDQHKPKTAYEVRYLQKYSKNYLEYKIYKFCRIPRKSF